MADNRPTVSLNGNQLNSISPKIYINQVTESRPAMNVNAVSNGTHIGQRVTHTEQNYLQIIVEFAVLQKDIALHSAILQNVRAWAADGGSLEVNYRDGQRLNVVCAAMFDFNVTAWIKNKYRITFRAYAVPYWEASNSRIDKTADAYGKEVSFMPYVSGQVQTPMISTMMALGTVDRIKIEHNSGQFIEFENLGLSMGAVILIDYVDGILHASASNKSILDKRTVESYDDILMIPGSGKNRITITADGDINAVIQTRGRWY